MGDYTRFEFDAKLVDDTPQEVVDTLKYMMDGGVTSDEDPGPELPTHALFKAERWGMVLRGASSYRPETQTTYVRSVFEIDDNGYRLKVLSSFKNYDNEIRLFCDWIAPYLDEDDGTEVGTTQFEYDDRATRLVKDRGVIVTLETENLGEQYDGPGLLHI